MKGCDSGFQVPARLSIMKGRAFHILAAAVCVSMTAAAEPLYPHGPREEINLAGTEWGEAIADTLDTGGIPPGLKWVPSEVPTRDVAKKLQSTDNQWLYNNVPPENYFNEDGAFKVTEKRSAWFRRSVEIPADLLEGRTVHFTAAGMSYKSGLIVNGRAAGESLQSVVPLDFDITHLVRPGMNELVVGITTREGLVDPEARVYLAPSMGAVPGIRGPIRLEFRPRTAVADVFVKTSVKNRNIDFQITIRNNRSEEVQVTPRIRVRSARGPMQVVGEFTGSPVTVAPNSETVTNLREDWVAPILWTPSTPEIYIADVTLGSGGSLVDRYRQTFGFREFSIRGKDFLLNGRRIVLLRSTSLSALKTLEHDPDEVSITQQDFNSLNSIRQHLGANNMDLVHRANQQGILVVPESAYSWVKQYSHDPGKVRVWLPGVLEYYKRWARQMRNEPSVVMYSLANETYWERNLPEEMAVAKEIVEVMRSEDPTRPLQADGDNSWNGLLDIINIHYPEGTAGTLRLKYPNSGIMVPNDLEWLTPEGGEGWRAKFVWDRPLVLGEFGGGGDWDSYASYGGDDVFDWIKWRKNTRSGMDFGASDPERGNYSIETLRKMVNIYRHLGVAGMTPWAGDKRELMKPMAVAPLDFHPNVDAGGVFKRKLAVFNDDKRPVNAILYSLTINGVLVADKRIDFYLDPGRNWHGTVEIPIPDLEYAATGEFMARLIWKRGNADVEVDRHVEDIFIVPSINLGDLAGGIALVDPGDTLESALKALGLGALERLEGDTVPSGKNLLIVGAGGFREDMAAMLDAFVGNGGVVLMLPQPDWKPYREELPERDSRHAATQTWARMPSHPALRDVREGQLSFWNKDNVVSYETFRKPRQGPLHVVIDAGGRFGLGWSPLLDIPLGKGTFLMTTLELATGDPAARQLLANLIRYGATRGPQSREPLNLLAGGNRALVDALALTGVRAAEGVGGSGPVLVDASADFEIGSLKTALEQGRTVWLHGFTPETLPKVASLLPAGASLKAVTEDQIGTMSVSDDPLIQGLSNFDFAWYIPKLYYGGPLFDDASVVAKSGDWLLDTNLFARDVMPLTAPGFLVRIEAGEGVILFDTMQWENALAKMPEKALRVASGILTNVGAEFRHAAKAGYAFVPVELSDFANMGYMDSVEGDGVGGWTDQGRNDMRFFLINHSGKGSGEEDGMDMPVPDFPTDVEFDGIPYKLVDPKANKRGAVLSFGSDEHAPKLPREAGPIPVNTKADVLWFLHALAWAGGKDGGRVAEYRVEYVDGTTTTIPVRRFVDVGDWHNPTKYANASIAWTGRNLDFSPVGFNAMSWKNPHPDRAIRSLSIRAGLDKSQYVLIGITAGWELEAVGE